MKRNLFVSDLDNTLLFSYKYRTETDICVEYLEGKPQGYFTKETPEALQCIMEKATFIPVTSRSQEQFLRIQFPEICRPKYAVTTNGAVLLVDGKVDPIWYQESLTAVEPWQKELHRSYDMLHEISLARRYRVVEDMFLFTACDNAADAQAVGALLAKKTTLDVEVSGRKVYFFPAPINKGTALEKLRKRFQAKKIVCAGDSSIDLPMLRQADLAIVPDRFLVETESLYPVRICPGSKRFYNFVLSEATDYFFE